MVAILHQPRYEIFDKTLDRVLLLAHGRVVYAGPSTDALDHFAALGYEAPPGNPAEFLLELLSGDPASIDDLIAGREKQTEGRAKESSDRDNEIINEEKDTKINNDTRKYRHSSRLFGTPMTAAGGANIFMQTWAAFYRQLLQRYRSPSVLAVFVLVHMFIGVVLGVGFLQSDGIFVPPVPTDIANLCPPPLTTLCRTEPIDWLSLRLSAFYLSLALGMPYLSFSKIHQTYVFYRLPILLTLHRHCRIGICCIHLRRRIGCSAQGGRSRGMDDSYCCLCGKESR